MIKNSFTSPHWLCLALLVSCLAGCQSLALFSQDPFAKVPVATPKNPVTEVVAMWESADGLDEQGRPARGFNGRIMFFQQDNRKMSKKGSRSPVRIDPEDEFLVYIFDDVGSLAEQERPLKVYKFTGAQCEEAQFLGFTNLGAEYDMFIPYPRGGAYASKCTLRVKYVPKEGKPKLSDFVKAELAGVPRPQPERVTDPAVIQDAGIQQAGYQVAQEQVLPQGKPPLTLPSPDQIRLQQDKESAQVAVQAFLKDYRQKQQPAYEPHYEVTNHGRLDPRETAQVLDLRERHVLEPASELETQKAAQPDRSAARHPLLDE